MAKLETRFVTIYLDSTIWRSDVIAIKSDDAFGSDFTTIQWALLGRADGAIYTRYSDWQSRWCDMYKVLRSAEQTWRSVQGRENGDLVTLEVCLQDTCKEFKVNLLLYETKTN